MAILDIFTLKLLENETVFWDTTVQNEENFLGQTSLKSTLSLINGNRVYGLILEYCVPWYARTLRPHRQHP